jgi:hypothetical protein
MDEHIHGEPATAAELSGADSIAVAADGTLLIADGGHGTIDRVAADGTIRVAARPPKRDDVTPELVTALPGGGFAFTADTFEDVTGQGARVYRVGPDGSVRRVAGGGPFAADPPAGLTRRVDGDPATGLPLPTPTGLSALPDGGLLLAYEPQGDEIDGDVVTYIAPDAPAVLAVALRRDRARVFRPGRANAVHVALTLPATVTLTAGGHSLTRPLPAGRSTMALPRPLSDRPYSVALTATDAAGRRADHRAAVFPAGWLPEETAELVVNAVAPEGVAVECRQYSAGRVDCQDETPANACRAVSVRFAHGRLRWGMYRACKLHAHPRFARPLRRLRRSDWHCEPEVPLCHPALFGRLAEADIIPAD